jgi:hypothetical protein
MAAPMLRSVIPVAVDPVILVNEYLGARKACAGKLEMESVRSAQEYRLDGPGTVRRLVLLGGACSISAAIAYLFPGVIGWNHGLLVVMGIAFLGGLSSLWSP